MLTDAATDVLRPKIQKLLEILPETMPGGPTGEPLDSPIHAAEILTQLQDFRARLDHCPDLLAKLERQADAVFERTKPGSEFAALLLEVQSCLPQKVYLTLATGLAGINDLSRTKSSQFLDAIETLRSVGHDANGYLGFQSTDELGVIEARARNLQEDKRLSELTALVPSLVEQLDRLRNAAKAIWSDPELTDIEAVSMLLDCRNPESELSAMLHGTLFAGVTAVQLHRTLSRLLPNRGNTAVVTDAAQIPVVIQNKIVPEGLTGAIVASLMQVIPEQIKGTPEALETCETATISIEDIVPELGTDTGDNENRFEFYPDGDGYFIAAFGESGHFSASKAKGWHDIHRLVQAKGKSVSFSELDGNAAIVLSGKQDAVDERTIKETEAEMRRLVQDIEDAESELEREELRAKIHMYTRYLETAKQKNGKPRDINSSDRNRARTRIAHRMSSVYGKKNRETGEITPGVLQATMPKTAEHLRNGITVGDDSVSYTYRSSEIHKKWKTTTGEVQSHRVSR